MSAVLSDDVVVSAHGLTLSARRGPVYAPVDLVISRGALGLVSGPDGSGKTSLLLTLAGRMVPDKGSRLSVLGYELPRERRAVQRASAAVGFAGLDDLDDAVTVGATLRERKAWLAPWYSIVRTPDDDQVRALLQPCFGELDMPQACTPVHDLDEAQNILLRLALAVMAEPDLVVVDQIDQLHDIAARDAVWRALLALTRTGTTVLVSATSPTEADRLGWDELLHIRLNDQR